MVLLDTSASVSKRVTGTERTAFIAQSTYRVTIPPFDTEVGVV